MPSQFVSTLDLVAQELDGVYGGRTTAAARTKIITLSGFLKI